MANNKKAANFIKAVYRDVWQNYSKAGFIKYYDKNVIGRSQNQSFNFERFYHFLSENRNYLSHMQPLFHQILTTGQDSFTTWFTSIHYNKNNEEAMRIKTMASYKIKDDKIIEVDFMWDQPIEFVMNQGKTVKENLSLRQAQCFFYLTQNYTAKQIAQIMNISSRTVETHIIAIKNKLGLHNNKEIMEYAINNGLVSLSPLLSSIANRKKSDE